MSGATWVRFPRVPASSGGAEGGRHDTSGETRARHGELAGDRARHPAHARGARRARGAKGCAIQAEVWTRSVDGAGWHYPCRRLTGHARDEIEVGIVVEHRKAVVLGGGGDQEVRNLPPAETADGEQPLDLAGPAQMRGIGLDQRKGRERRGQARPLRQAAGGEPDLEVRDPARPTWPPVTSGSTAVRTAVWPSRVSTLVSTRCVSATRRLGPATAPSQACRALWRPGGRAPAPRGAAPR
jgi:hypothetical protein